ncbi:MAG: kynureninase [Flavobacteriales bacterium]|nr:kynureninase [Flavobacteriia bacterium]NCP06654.1 kynureninase [Flavobacteriales bacterium]PIV93957.1 MAG: kynureninase [Flavobacteriaceae bacterium CG17_big_fil_post_rev_8_21_14_2_50_33_15]PIY11623.1 MAG: kynureninase [Flavobacteriaceae bacterium CG_4_10_14_3_um_filter_33_47]PJB20415.1 MAG: kynureninase [Flavobacteriaceae bacterium CG_4_9_14_3_um_filter_33_16]
MLNYQLGLDFALEQDQKDALSAYRNQFHIPKDKQGNELIYMTGNSLGLQPKITKKYINQELEDWANLGVEGHTNAKNPWLKYHEFLTESMSEIVGAKPNEVVVMNTLTVNLHLMMVSFYKPTAKRYKILIEADAFPSDKYAVESQLRHHGFNDKEGLILWKARQGKELVNYEDLEAIFEAHGNEIALVMIGGVNYYTGQYFDMKRITNLGHKHGCMVGFDCAHGAGNVELNLHDSGADFAVWCTYKYLNSGPGSLAGCFVHERHANNKDLNRFTGWWSHNKETRFRMRDEFDQLPGAEGWQLSNPPILSMAAIKASLDMFHQVGIKKLVEKSKNLTGYFEFLLKQLGEDTLRIITPSNPEERGCQLSIQVKNADKSLHHKLTEAGVISDWREPDVIRCAPVPLYNSFQDVYHLVNKLKVILNE